MLYRLINKTAFPVTRHLIYHNLRVQVPRCQPMLLQSKGSIHSSATQLFASASDWQHAPKHPVIEKLQRHPHIMQQLVDFTALLQSKGVDVSGKQPSFMQVMKVMNDPEIKEKVKVLAQDMQAAGIQLDMQTIQELQADFKVVADQYQSPEPTSNETINEKQPEKKSVLNKVKGLFKK